MTKIKILELDVTTITELFTAYSAGIYAKVMTVPQATQDAGFMTTVFGLTGTAPSAPISIGSVRVDDNILGEVDSVAELREQDGSFFFDQASQTLYLALFDYQPADSYHQYKTGETSGFISAAQKQTINGKKFPVNSYLGATYYEPRLSSDLSVEESIDDQKNGIFIFENLEASLNNGDGKFDNIREQVVGNEARILMAFIADSPEDALATGFPYKDAAEQEDFNVIREGIIEDVDYSDPNSPSIRAIDRRSDWSQKISPNLMTVAEYANLEDKNINKFKPLLIGQVSGTECIRLEPKPGSSTAVDFLICDTSVGDIATVTDIYFDGKISGADVDRVLAGGEYSVDLTTGILTVNNYDSGNAYFYGSVTTLQETVEIVLFLLNEYANFAYIPSNYNKNEIEQIRALDYTTHVYIEKKGKELFKVIEKLVMDIQVDFFQQGSILTMRKSNEERASSEDVPLYQVLDNPSGWVSDRTDTVKTISVSYDQDYRLKSGTTYFDATNEEAALESNLKAIDKSFETNLISQADVIEIYDEYYTRFTAPSRTVTINRTIPFTAGLTDFVTANVTRQNKIDGDTDVFPRGIYKIVNLDQNSNTAEIVYFSDRPEPYYSQGLAHGRRAAFGQQDLSLAVVFYSGIASGRNASFRNPPQASRAGNVPVATGVSGNVNGQTQTVGE